MNRTIGYSARTLVAAAVALTLAACATAPSQSAGVTQARAKLTALQSDSNLAHRAPVALKEAQAAVVAAETHKADEEQETHLVYLADRKVDTARAQAEARFAEEQRVKLGEQRDRARLEARTHEADLAKGQVASARTDADEQKREADIARSAAATARTETETARIAAQTAQDAARLQSEELQRQIDDLQAKATDRGLVLTLGDVLFTTGKADLNAGATSSLNKLATFLNRYPERNAVIEGHTDSAGSDDYNLGLSQRRADSVKSYLTGQGIGTVRLAAAGKGESLPLAGNESAAGRQQNRRVEVIIENPPPTSKE